MVDSVKIQPQMNTNNPTAILSQIKERFPFLHYVVLVHFALLAFTVTSMFIDSRELMGINVWIKPTKFILSSIIVLWTMGWYFLVYPYKRITASILASLAAFLMILENVLISVQAWRGVTSHYNIATPFDALVFGLMGLAIGLFTLIVFWFFVKSFSSKLEFSNAMKWSFRIAWFTFLFGSAIGGSMIEQNAHNVGVADGGNGIPFLNWSTEGGDLRIAHFFGLHGIQIIPLVAYFISKKFQGKSLITFLSIAFGLFYLGWIAFTFYQAKQGQPLL